MIFFFHFKTKKLMKTITAHSNTNPWINDKPLFSQTGPKAIAMALACCLVLLAFASPAMAQIQRSDFAGNGVPIKVTDFNNASGGVYALDLNLLTNTYNTKANMKATVDLDAKKINVREYSHFASNQKNDPVVGNGTSQVTTQSEAYCKYKLYLRGNTLYAEQIMNPGGPAAKLRVEPSSWTPPRVDGTNVTHVAYAGPKSGYFQQLCGKDWVEYKTGKVGAHASFRETHRDEWSVYLQKSDGARIQLDLHTKQMKVNNSVAANISTARAGGLQ
jgi:hypothetical protein